MTVRLEIDLKRLEENVRYEIQLLGQHGVSLMGVNKVFNGSVETVKTLMRAGVRSIAEARIENLKKLAHLPVQKCLIRSPGKSEIEDTIRFADVSLNSEVEILRLLSREAVRQGKVHLVLLMIDIGDLREGLWHENRDQIFQTVQEILTLPGLDIYGLGTNFNCYGTVKPSQENLERLLELANSINTKFQIQLPFLSGGSSTSHHLIDKGIWPQGINQLRIGGLHLFGIEYVEMKYVHGFHHSSGDVLRATSPLYILKAEILEINSKPTVPVGELGLNAFLQKKSFQDRGIRKRAILGFGRQDLPYENLVPVDSWVTLLGQSSDHTLVDIENCERALQIGDWLEFELDYTALLYACNSPGVKKVYLESSLANL